MNPDGPLTAQEIASRMTLPEVQYWAKEAVKLMGIPGKDDETETLGDFLQAMEGQIEATRKELLGRTDAVVTRILDELGPG